MIISDRLELAVSTGAERLIPLALTVAYWHNSSVVKIEKIKEECHLKVFT